MSKFKDLQSVLIFMLESILIIVVKELSVMLKVAFFKSKHR